MDFNFQQPFPKDPPPYDAFMHSEGLSDSEYGSDYEQPANTTESSLDESVESESDFDDGEAGFKRLDSSRKKQLVIKDGKIIKSEKIKGLTVCCNSFNEKFNKFMMQKCPLLKHHQKAVVDLLKKSR